MPVHFRRYIGKTRDKDGNKVDVPGTWLDLRRSDTLVFEEGSGFDYQKTELQLKHYEDESQGGNKPEPNARRKTVTVTIVPADQDPNDPQLFFEVDAIEELTLQDADQLVVRLFDNSAHNATRRGHARIRRVFHYDTPYDDDPRLAEGGIIQTPEGATLRDYRKITDPDTKDSGQYLDVEIIETYQFDDYRPEKRLKPPYEFLQRTTVQLDSQELMDNSEDPPKNYDAEDLNPPWRLDPYQNIVNIQDEQPQKAVIGRVVFTDPLTLPEIDDTQISKDGTALTAGFAPPSASAATGLGYVVIAQGRKKSVVFGRPKDGQACFIAIVGDDIKRGVLNKQGKLVFSALGTLPGPISPDDGEKAASFAGGAFFVTYVRDSRVYLAVSFDGSNFQYDVNAFPGVDSPSTYNPDGIASSPPNRALGGVVAYDSKNQLYVTTGSFLYNYKAAFTSGDLSVAYQPGDTNFMSATSRDGLAWSARFVKSRGQGIGSSVDGSADVGGARFSASEGSDNVLLGPAVCFGNGLFVASTYFKIATTRIIGSDTFSEFLLACGVATSRDGRSWTNRRLPGSIAFDVLTPDPIHAGGMSSCAAFFRTGGVTGDGHPKGFFVVGGAESTPAASFPFRHSFQGKLWTSEDGSSWKLLDTAGSKVPFALSAINKSVDLDHTERQVRI